MSLSLIPPSQPLADKIGDRRKDEGWFVCQTKRPAVQLVLPVVSKRDKCSGTAKIQGMMWKCGKLKESPGLTRKFFRMIVDRAEERCEEECESRAPGCRAIFKPPSFCQFSVGTNYGKHMGERVGCHSRCEGDALIYCSLYHSSLLSIDAELLRGARPNCTCYKTKETKGFSLPFL